MKKSLKQMFLEAETKESNRLTLTEASRLALKTIEQAEAKRLEFAEKEAAAELDKCVIRPGEPIPLGYLDVLKSWKAFREHPAWKNHPQLK